MKMRKRKEVAGQLTMGACHRCGVWRHSEQRPGGYCFDCADEVIGARAEQGFDDTGRQQDAS